MLLRDETGVLLPLEPTRWHGSSTRTEDALLAGLSGPVLDVGCGPGRIVDRLAHRGIAALGVDSAPGAVALARRRGCAVLQRSVFDRLPLEGKWGSVLLFDGNIGIGGDPVGLLRRCRDLAGPVGTVVVEVEPPYTGWRTCRARLERGGEASDWFAWAVVGADAIAELGGQGGLSVGSMNTTDDGRWFAFLRRGGLD